MHENDEFNEFKDFNLNFYANNVCINQQQFHLLFSYRIYFD